MNRPSLAQRYWARLTDRSAPAPAPARRTPPAGYTFRQRYWASLTDTDLLLLSPRSTPRTRTRQDGTVEALASQRIEASLEQIFLRLAAPTAGMAGAEE
ncbi:MULTISPECIES: hypothetical protein [unclassified Streptomyces]|uniref:hypothetical protein n=1 Tax=unclassified Streptomyces TaxID=2593676 RepID=UPI0006B216D1|nr:MULTISPECIES: hypothetical protein [unclassified Streptomyces]KOY59060.1 hypothetical protein ADK59_04460 [Streptomyces sp. XY332]THA31366.1 hypothetical protein E6W17_35750 [Streptomyces sp. A1547]